MPELPELEVVREVLQRRVVGQTITGVEVFPPGGPIVVRDLTHAGFTETLTGATFTHVIRRGKFLVFSLHATQSWLPHVVFTLSDGGQLRYVDQKRMGQLYLTRDLAAIPDYAEMGPEPFDISLE